MTGKRKIALVAAAGTLMLPGGGVGSAAPEPKPSLSLRSSTPLVLRGQGFRALERVDLTVRAGDVTRRRTLRATSLGTFTVAFPGIASDRCNSDVRASAAGRRGSLAALRLGKLPQLQCPVGIP